MNVPGPSGASSAGGSVRGQNEERDRWLYEQCCRGLPHAAIRHQLDDRIAASLRNSAEAWEPISTIEGIRRAAQRYANRHGLTLPPTRKKPRKNSPLEGVESR